MATRGAPRSPFSFVLSDFPSGAPAVKEQFGSYLFIYLFTERRETLESGGSK